jgi:DNA invertase Pin-like site-specific DNA recombinase
MTNLRAVIYNRISSPSQIGRDGILRQSETNKAHAETHGLKVFAEISICESGQDIEEQLGLRAALDIANKLNARLLVEDYSRLTRSGSAITEVPIVQTGCLAQEFDEKLKSIILACRNAP